MQLFEPPEYWQLPPEYDSLSFSRPSRAELALYQDLAAREREEGGNLAVAEILPQVGCWALYANTDGVS